MSGTLGGTQYQPLAVVNNDIPGYYVNASCTVDGNGNLITLTNQGAVTMSTANAVSIYTESSSVITANGTGSAITVNNVETLFVTVNVSSVSGTNPTLTVSVQTADANANWFTVASTVSITSTGGYILPIGPGLINNYPVMNSVRFVTTVGGTSPSFTIQRGILGK